REQGLQAAVVRLVTAERPSSPRGSDSRPPSTPRARGPTATRGRLATSPRAIPRSLTRACATPTVFENPNGFGLFSAIFPPPRPPVATWFPRPQKRPKPAPKSRFRVQASPWRALEKGPGDLRQ